MPTATGSMNAIASASSPNKPVARAGLPWRVLRRTTHSVHDADAMMDIEEHA